MKCFFDPLRIVPFLLLLFYSDKPQNKRFPRVSSFSYISILLNYVLPISSRDYLYNQYIKNRLSNFLLYKRNIPSFRCSNPSRVLGMTGRYSNPEYSGNYRTKTQSRCKINRFFDCDKCLSKILLDTRC